MRFRRLSDSASQRTVVPGLTKLIDAFGAPGFAPAMFRSTYAWAKVDHLTAFLTDAGQSPRVIMAENAGDAPVAREVAARYCCDYWRHDLATQFVSDRPENANGSWMVHTKATEIAHSEYRRHCYTLISLDDRISLSERRGRQTWRVNLYRRYGRPFSEESTALIIDSAPLLLALVRGHTLRIISNRRDTFEHYRERLSAVGPTLTPREVEVCASIVKGLTSEGTALELGIGLNTVLTYKKRAYARLGISSQNELMRLVLN